MFFEKFNSFISIEKVGYVIDCNFICSDVLVELLIKMDIGYSLWIGMIYYNYLKNLVNNRFIIWYLKYSLVVMGVMSNFEWVRYCVGIVNFYRNII